MRASDKITVVSFIAMYMVVLIHSNMGWAGTRIVECCTQWAVPWFFFVSGAFFRSSMMKHDRRELTMRKIKSLVVPFGLWSLLAFPFGGNPDLWYLKGLIVFTFVSLGIACLGIHFEKMLFPIVFAAFFGVMLFFKVGWTYGTPTSPFYFLGGILCSRFLIKEWGRPKKHLVVIVCTCAILSRAAWIFVPLPVLGEMLLRNICVVMLGLSVWTMVSLLEPQSLVKLKCVKTTFFIYCFHHHYVLDWAKPLWRGLFGDSAIAANGGIFAVAACAFALSGIVALGMKKYLPRCYGLLSGGR